MQRGGPSRTTPPHLRDGRPLHDSAGVEIEVEFHPVEGGAVSRDLDDRHAGKAGGRPAARGEDDHLATGGDESRDRLPVVADAVQQIEPRAFRVFAVAYHAADRAGPRLVDPAQGLLGDRRDSSVFVPRGDQGRAVLNIRGSPWRRRASFPCCRSSSGFRRPPAGSCAASGEDLLRPDQLGHLGEDRPAAGLDRSGR